MALGSALSIAQNSLAGISRHTGVVARNVQRADDPNYTRREAVTESHGLGVRTHIVRAEVDQQLVRSSIDALSTSSAQRVLAEEMRNLGLELNGLDGEYSVARYLGDLSDGLQLWSASPEDGLLGESAINAARTVADRLNAASSAVDSARRAIDADIAKSVTRLNGLLEAFDEANSRVVQANRVERTDNDARDQRDALVRDIAALTGIRVTRGEHDDMQLFTTEGHTLFERVPREVSFSASPLLAPGSIGNSVLVDGLPQQVAASDRAADQGSIGALLTLRDQTLPSSQAQLDEMARGLIEVFAETGSGIPDLAGLFTYSGGPSLAPTGTHVPGLAGSIQVAAAYDPLQSGDASLVRDGGANGAAYIANPSGQQGYGERLASLADALETTRGFDTTTGLSASASLVGLAGDSIGWLDGLTSDATARANEREALHAQLTEKLTSARGVDLDEEMSRLLELERSYEASARMISAVDEMLATLLAVVR